MQTLIRTTSMQIGLNKKNSLMERLKRYWQVYVLMSAGIMFFIFFKLLPLWGLCVAFVDYNIVGGLFKSNFVGFKYFTDFIQSDNFFLILRNTLVISGMDIVFAFPAPIILSILLNEVNHRRFKKLSQSIVYMPHFMSWPVIAGLTFFMFSTDVGIVNKIIMNVGGEAVPFLTSKSTFWWVLLGQNLWKDLGWGTIIYLAAISQIDPGMYEAAIIDGASRVQQIRHITIPCLVPTIVILLLMRLGRIMDVSFEQVWMLQNDMVRSVAQTFEVYSFLVGVQMGNYSVGTAVGLFKSIVGLMTVLTSNWLIKKSGNEGMF